MINSMNYNQFLVVCDIFVLNVYLQSNKREVWFLLLSVDIRFSHTWSMEVDEGSNQKSDI